MNLSCTNCGEVFRVTADQLGTRGKCPHCKATIILPRAAHDVAIGEELRPPPIWFERWLSALGTVVLHLIILAIFAMLPARTVPLSGFHEGQPVLIGHSTGPESGLTEDTKALDRVPVDSSTRAFSVFPAEKDASSDSASAMRTPESVLFGDGGGGEFSENALAPFRGEEDHSDKFALMLDKLQSDGLELVITFDSTGSMEGEIGAVKERIEKMGSALLRLVPRTRISICSYRDYDEQYLVKGLPLTDDLGEVVRFLNSIDAAGGGDEPEAVYAGLQWSVEKNRFREGARKVVLLFGDSPPHARERSDALRLASEFRRKQGGIVSTVTCRQSERIPAFIEIARLGGGEAFQTQNEQEIMAQLMILIFGSEHREKVLEAFDMMIR